MAVFNLNITASDWTVTKTEVVTSCATQYRYMVTAAASADIDVTLSGSHESTYYELNGAELALPDAVNGITFNNSLSFYFVLPNSGASGVFLESIITIENNSSTNDDPVYTDTAIRPQDDQNCDDTPSDPGGTYDELTDTPASKIGEALKIVRVNAGETAHEYIDLGLLGNDLNFTSIQGSSASWVIAHNLGKIPSVTIQDGSGNTIYGDITFTDLNNLTITFNTAFAGTAYLN